MSSPAPFTETELPDAKAAFAEAYQLELKRTPFGEPDPFRAALTLWNEDNGKLPKALWVAHSAKWHEDEEIVAAIDEAIKLEEEENETEKFKYARNKELGRELVLQRLYQQIETERDSDKLVKLANEIAKYQAHHEKPEVSDPLEGRVLGVIHHRLAPMDNTQFEDAAANQQAALQRELLELTATDATPIN